MIQRLIETVPNITRMLINFISQLVWDTPVVVSLWRAS